MKRILSVLLALLMLCGSFSAFAAESNVPTNELLGYVNKQIKSAAAYYTAKNADDFTAENAADLLTLLNAGYDISAYRATFLADVKENLKKNGGRLVSAYTGKEDIGLYGGVIGVLKKLGYNPKSYEGCDLVAAFEAVHLKDAVSNPYFYRVAIEAAEPAFAETLTADMVSRYYVKGKGMKHYGYSCDNTCVFLTALARCKGDYADIVNDAKAVVQSYTKTNGAYSDNTYVTVVNADSTALAMMAYAALGDTPKAYWYYGRLVQGFEGKTGVFQRDGTDNTYATKEALLALEYFKTQLIAEGIENPKNITAIKTVKATTKKNGKIIKYDKISGKTLKTTVIYKPKKIKTAKKKYKYTGKRIKPKVTVYNGKGKKISKKYYTVKYKNNKKRGKATIVVKFRGRYKGTMKKTFKIR